MVSNIPPPTASALPPAQTALAPPPKRKPTPPPWPIPKFNVRIEDLGHPGAELLFATIKSFEKALTNAVVASFEWLYTPATAPDNVKLITLVFRPMDGVAHTFGSESEKEIHFSLDHINNSEKRAEHEILGVLTHEVVHCYQYNAKGTANGGLIEGIADYVRLHANFPPPHWKRSGGDNWDAGYQTTAYFLDWIEQTFGEGFVRQLNGILRDREWDDLMFEELIGTKVSELWQSYCEFLEVEEKTLDPNAEKTLYDPRYKIHKDE